MKNKRAVEAMKKICENRRVVADSAEPRTIAEMRDLGLRVVAARKGPDSIDHGIRWLQNLQKIVVDKNRCPNTYRELVSYEYDKNKNGQFISSYPDKNNHCLTGDTIVQTINGGVPIKDLVGKAGKLFAYDTELQQTVIADFCDCRMTQRNAAIIQIELEDGRTIKATAEHPILTKNGWKCAGNLTSDDEILDIGNV